MNQVFPNISTVLASSTTDVGVLSTYLFPIIVFAFICVVAAAGIRFVLNLIQWVGEGLKISPTRENTTLFSPIDQEYWFKNRNR